MFPSYSYYCYPLVYGQVATLDSKVVFPSHKDSVNPIKFIINNQKFGEKDTLIKIQLNRKGLDKCVAIIGKDTLRFFAKFKADESYKIEQGCCCAAFTIEAHKNPKRGTVTFKNQTNRDLALIACEHNSDTIKKKSMETLLASESAMCLFKPCSIQVAETQFLSDVYNYKNDERDYDSLWKEQKKFVLIDESFLFLHGEKVEIKYDEKKKKSELVVVGYLD